MIREIKKKLVVLSNRRPFPKAAKEYIDHLERVDWVYMNLKLDGSPLTRDETEHILAGEPILKGRIMDHVMAQRLDDVRNELYDLSQRKYDVKPELVRIIGAKIGSDPPEYRKTTPQLVECSYTPVLPSEIPEAMEAFTAYANQAEEFENPFEKAAGIHNRFLAIYPYDEGNQITARALMEYFLLIRGFPMAYIELSESQYNGMFAEFCRTGKNSLLAEHIAKAVADRLELMIQLTGY